MEYGVNRVYSPEDGRELGLEGMIADMLERADFSVLPENFEPQADKLVPGNVQHIARSLTWIEQNKEGPEVVQNVLTKLTDQGIPAVNSQLPVIGFTGTGGAGNLV